MNVNNKGREENGPTSAPSRSFFIVIYDSFRLCDIHMAAWVGGGGLWTHFLFIFSSSAILSLDPKERKKWNRSERSNLPWRRDFPAINHKAKSGELESASDWPEWKSDDCINSSLFLTFLALPLVCVCTFGKLFPSLTAVRANEEKWLLARRRRANNGGASQSDDEGHTLLVLIEIDARRIYVGSLAREFMLSLSSVVHHVTIMFNFPSSTAISFRSLIINDSGREPRPECRAEKGRQRKLIKFPFNYHWNKASTKRVDMRLS